MTGSMQLPHELMIFSGRGRANWSPNVTGGKGRIQMVRINLSSRAIQRDAWNLHIMSSIRGSLSPLASRRGVLVCQAVFGPSGANKIPVLETAALVLTRSCDVLVANPLLVKLIPAVGIIALATWGLGPLVRLGRSVILQKSDNSWKNSSAHYVLTSYVQPLLLWTGTTLVCSELDPLLLPSAASQAVKQRLLNFVRSLSTVLAFAYCISSLIQQAQKLFKDTNTNDSSDATTMSFTFAGKAVSTAVWVAAVSLFMELLGFSAQKWVTAGGLGTVLITLAGREILNNFLSSIMIHATRPFVLNQWIQTNIEGYDVSGTIEHVGWWSPTIIRGDDREAVYIPNHKFTENVLRNLSQKTHWRIKTYLGISHLDVNKINKIVADMRKVLAKNPQVEQQKLHRRVFLEEVSPDQALKIQVSCFVKTSHFGEYLGVKEAILLDLLRVISHHQARLATPIRTVQKSYSDADLDDVPFDDDNFTRSRSPDRPYLLIEPSYKVSDDKVKSPAHAVSEVRDGKSEAVPEYEFKDELDPGSTSPAIPDSRKDKTTAAVTSASGPSSKVPATQASETPPRNSVQDNPVQLNSDTPHPNEGTANASTDTASPNSEVISQGGMQKRPSSFNPASDPERNANSLAKKTEKFIASTMAARPPLEENIVLGVALEGSKRTLPIDEEIAPSSSPLESKELAASRNGGASSGAKGMKDGQASSQIG